MQFLTYIQKKTGKLKMKLEELKEIILERDSEQILDVVINFNQKLIHLYRNFPDYHVADILVGYLPIIERGEQILSDQTYPDSVQHTKAISLINLAKAIVYFKLGSIEESLALLDNNLKLVKDLDDKLSLADIYLTYGDLYGSLGDSSLADRHYENSRLLFKEFGDDRDYLNATIHIANSYSYQGKLPNSLKYYQTSLKLSKDLANSHMEVVSLSGIAWNYRVTGELDKALELYNKCLTLADELEWLPEFPFIMWPLLHLGDLYLAKGDYPLAIEYYTRSLTTSRQVNHEEVTAWNYYHLMRISLDKDSLNEAKEYLDHFYQLNRQARKKSLVKSLYKLSRAIFSKKNMEYQKAKTLLKQVMKDIKVFNSIKVHAMLQLSEITLLELKKSKTTVNTNKNLRKEWNELIGNLQNIAADQTSYVLSAESSLLQAKFALLEKDLEKAQTFLDNARIIADEKGLTGLAKRISLEYPKLLKKGDTPFRILLLFLVYQELSLREISDRLKITKAGIHRHLKMLTDMNMVQVSREEQVRSKQIKAKYYVLNPDARRMFQTFSVNLWQSVNQTSDYSMALVEQSNSLQMIVRIWQVLIDLLGTSMKFIEKMPNPEIQSTGSNEMGTSNDIERLQRIIKQDDEIVVQQLFLTDEEHEVFRKLWAEFSEKVQKEILDKPDNGMKEKTNQIFNVILPLKVLFSLEQLKK